MGGAVQAGYLYAVREHYDVIVRVDGDGQHDATYIPDMVKEVADNGTDICIGSRFIDNKGYLSSGFRRIGIFLISSLVKICCGVRIKDITSGFWATNSAMAKLFAENYQQDYPEPEAVLVAVQNGATIRELPVQMKERMEGESSINLRRSVYYMVKVALSILLTHFSMRGEVR